MARLLLAGLLGLALVLLSAATEVNDGQLETLEEAGQALLRQDGLTFGRQERSAEPGKKGKKKKSKNGARKMKKNKNKGTKKDKQTKKRGKKNQGKVNRKGKKNNRNGKGNKRAKENRNARNRNNRKKKNKKGPKKEKVKGKAQKRKNMKQRKQIQTKGKGKKDKKNRNKNKIIRDSCLPLVCINNAVKSMTIVKGKIFSFEKQLKRFEKMSKQAVNKVGKKHVFKPALMRLQHHGGGNASELSCGGNKTNAGALQMQNLTNLLTACEDQVHEACHDSNHPAPNATELASCLAAIDHFKNFEANCTSQTTATAMCDCFDADNATTKVMAELRACDLKELSNNHTAAVKSCKSAFGTCRKYEDDVSHATHTCDQDPDALKKKLKNLSVNKAEMDKILATMSSALRSLRRSPPGDRVSVPGTRQATVSTFFSVVTQITVMVSQNPVSYSIYTLAVTISTVSVTFSSSDMAQLTALETSMSSAVTTMEAEITTVSATITTLTGEVLTEEDIDNLEVCETDAECIGGTTLAPTTTTTTTTPELTTSELTTEGSEATSSSAAATTAGNAEFGPGGDPEDLEGSGYGYGGYGGEGEEPVLITGGFDGEEPVLITGPFDGEQPILIPGFGSGEQPILITGFGSGEQPILIPGFGGHGYGGYGSESGYGGYGSNSGYGGYGSLM